MPETFTNAINTILNHIKPTAPENIFLDGALGRVLATPVKAPWDIPRWDNSAMDGYAIHAADSSCQCQLQVTGFIAAGETAQDLEVSPGTAVKIMTGAPTPPGCAAVVPVENTREDSGKIIIEKPVPLGSHIRWQSEDIQQQQVVLKQGTILQAPHINLLASLGFAQVSVSMQPRIAILATGDELVELGQTPGESQIINSNSYALAAAVKEAGGVPVMLGTARDCRQSLLEKLHAGQQADMLITSAGISAGDRDLVRQVLDELGLEIHFWKVDIKPGRPTAFGQIRGVPTFCLPGNPVASILTFEAFVRPALRKMTGHQHFFRPVRQGRLEHEVKRKSGRREFMRVLVTENSKGELFVSSAGDQNTGIMSTMVRANGVAILPEDRGNLLAGEYVTLFLLNPAEPLEQV
ncbi:gephyrin-like molybdotransferase Glp [Desulfurispira natronophila]|uniref:Molybdopterin molybdenumtransferase n=1 Tax=Desulfurispira natronophila TaxID=682562 RepID=A0A7W8DHN8_9BACT|nr:gephyrin-like molybdotransferase Glp [Desulfurispira natronophila]MBB5022680.1 molybdopterin molybdotransferase [Desulfurispira natronophila]